MNNRNLPRGYRNCNPGNLRKSKDKWQGLREEQTDNAFFQFETMAYGYRAMLITLRNYRKRHGCRTLASIINRYAPPSENSTSSYLAFVCNELQVPTTYEPDVNDRDTMCALVAAMSKVENGLSPIMDDIYKAWEMIG